MAPAHALCSIVPCDCIHMSEVCMCMLSTTTPSPLSSHLMCGTNGHKWKLQACLEKMTVTMKASCTDNFRHATDCFPVTIDFTHPEATSQGNTCGKVQACCLEICGSGSIVRIERSLQYKDCVYRLSIPFPTHLQASGIFHQKIVMANEECDCDLSVERLTHFQRRRKYSKRKHKMELSK